MVHLYPHIHTHSTGIGNCSETDYIRAFVHYGVTNNYRVAVLNHIGALQDTSITGNRLFTYGIYSVFYCIVLLQLMYALFTCTQYLLYCPSYCNIHLYMYILSCKYILMKDEKEG